MKMLSDWFLSFRRAATFEDVEIYHETETAILVELNEQTIWLPKNKIKISRQNDLATITIPLDIIRKKFPSKKYTQFSDY